MENTANKALGCAFALAVLLLGAQLTSSSGYLGFHRDELMYLALGKHLDWGFWSNPPFIGFISYLGQQFFGSSLLATHVLPALSAAGVLWLMALMMRALGGGMYAQLLCGASMFCSIAWLRAFSMLQPVPFDIFFWSLLSYFLLQWLKTGADKWWLYIGLAAGIGMLNKYTVALWVVATLGALLLNYRRSVFTRKAPWVAALLAGLILLPNALWQIRHHFPVLHHLKTLQETQLQHVQAADFLKDQLLVHAGFAPLWIAGLFALLFSVRLHAFRPLAWQYLLVVGILLVLKGKSYYTLGAYPMLFAAGAVALEAWVFNVYARAALLTVFVAISGPLMPTGKPFLPVNQLVAYFEWLKTDVGVDAPLRWEDGRLHTLPQDYADMLGWEELAALTDQALLQAGPLDSTVVYAENYGQAAAVEHFCKQPHPPAFSFSDSYLLWVPENLSAGKQNLIYINDELGDDIKGLYGDIRCIGTIQNPLAREKGTGVWLCKRPKASFPALWKHRVREERE